MRLTWGLMIGFIIEGQNESSDLSISRAFEYIDSKLEKMYGLYSLLIVKNIICYILKWI